MNRPKLTIWKILVRKTAVIILIAGSAAASFATLGDGKSKSASANSSLLSTRKALNPGLFSLRSGYTYRGNKVINHLSDKKYININTVVTLQKGNTTFVVPLKKKVVFDKIKIDISNRQFKRN